MLLQPQYACIVCHNVWMIDYYDCFSFLFLLTGQISRLNSVQAGSKKCKLWKMLVLLDQNFAGHAIF